MIIMGAYLLARLLDLPEWVVAVAMAFVALFLVGFGSPSAEWARR